MKFTRKQTARILAFAAMPVIAAGAVGLAQACPGINNEMLTRPVSLIVGAEVINNGVGAFSYKLTSADQSPSGGIPGVIEYCVYSNDMTPVDSKPFSFVAPTAWTVDPALATIWKETGNAGDYFGFGRKDGNPSNIPLDGHAYTVGSATFDTDPLDQFVLLHINDAAECYALYGEVVETCFVRPGYTEPRPPDQYTISGAKYYDANANGRLDGTEVEIPSGFSVVVSFPDSALPAQTLTAPWSLKLDQGTEYRVCEVTPLPPWIHTGPNAGETLTDPLATADADKCWNGTVEKDRPYLDMGNVCVGAGGGLTLGFWSNKNGQALVGADDLAMLAGLNLRDGAGASFDPTTYAQFRPWLLGANATNMAYMLSAQLAAMELNVYNGKVAAGALVYAGAAPAGCTVAGLNGNGFIGVADLMTAANDSLGMYGYTVAAGVERTCQEFLKTALDRANNNLTFVQPDPAHCPAPAYTQ